MFPPVVRAVVISPEEKILMVRHRASDPWVFPWGHVEAGESLHEALLREIYEELWIRCTFEPSQYEESLGGDDTLTMIPLPITWYQLSYSRDGKDRSRSEYIFVLLTEEDTIKKQEKEILFYEWFTPDAIAWGSTETFPMNQKVIEKLFYGDEE